MKKPKIILGIESSCDETAVAVVQKADNGVQILSNVVASSAQIQARYGGVIPEQAAREQLSSIIPVINEALRLSFDKLGIAQGKQSLDAIAVTQGPGLIGSLLVGVETAKTLALLWNKPLVPVNHLLGHFYANWVMEVNSLQTTPSFPLIGLLVSGGHTDLILMTGHGKYQYLGGTRDDAAGEAFDKTARLLGLPYPGGPVVAQLAEKGNPKAYQLPRPMIDSDNLDFSFSGLKTAVSNLVQSLQDLDNNKADISASIQEAIVDVLVTKTLKAAQKYQVKQVMLAGGVAANQRLGQMLLYHIKEKKRDVEILIPTPKLCTDNGVYIATAALFNYHPTNPLDLQADPSLSLSKR